MYRISTFAHFDSAHYLRGYRGKCASIHGHRWKVEVAMEGENLDEQGILIDFMDVKGLLKKVTDEYDHKLINEVPPFDELNPTAENMAKTIFDRMAEKLQEMAGSSVRVTGVTVWESETAGAAYFTG